MIRKAAACVIALSIVLGGGFRGTMEAFAGETSFGISSEEPVSYLGPEGTYTEEATQRFFGRSGDYRPQETVQAALQRLLDGSCKYAVIPQENTIGGPVYEYLDALLAQGQVSVQGEVELPISQTLLVKEGTELLEIKTVYSHKQGIVQSAEWLAKNLPSAKVVETASTAEGARMVAASGTADCAAIASAGAAEVYGLRPLAEGIQANDDNQTRFYVVSLEAPGQALSDRMLFTARGDAENLPKLMEKLSQEGLKLVSIHDRPAKTVLGEYVYLIECEAGSYQAYERLCSIPGFQFQFYGTFPVK